MKRWLWLVLQCAGVPTLLAQGPGFQLGHLFTDPSATSYRLGTTAEVLGPLGAGIHAVVVDGRGPMGNLWGLGADLSLYRSGQAGPYGLGGFEGGVETQGDHSFWSSWSVGAGYEFFPIHGLSLALEGRYRRINPGRFHGVELGLRLGLDRASRGPSGRQTSGPSAPPRLATSTGAETTVPDGAEVRADLDRDGVSADRVALIGDVVQTALDVMGMPYRWGDEGENGFDCSGLIRYAFGKHGITLPRRSVDQAREGSAVARSLDQLRPGDVLTFATSGSRVSHVGLYIGNGKFIHSASQGVQISVLSPDDVSGRWWYQRWVGVRRIVG
jgi:cell wall-associated NlpC family hydrolase